MIEYIEISLLKQFKKKHQISIQHANIEPIDKHLVPVEFKILNNTYLILVEDEYQDLSIHNELLHLVIILKELETIEESTDFLDWCQQLHVNASNEKLLSYYKTTNSYLHKIKAHFEDGKLNSFISDLDYQLNAGAIQILRLSNNI